MDATSVAVGLLLPDGVGAAALRLAGVEDGGAVVRLTASIGDLPVLRDLDGAVAVAVDLPVRVARDVLGAPAALVVQGAAVVRVAAPEVDRPGGLRGWLLRDHLDHPVEVEVRASRLLSWPRHDSPAAPEVLLGDAGYDPRPVATAEVARLPAPLRPSTYAEPFGRADQRALAWAGRDGAVHVRRVTCHLDEGGGLATGGAGLPGDSCPAAMVAHGTRGRGRSQVRLRGWFEAGRSRLVPTAVDTESILPVGWARDVAIGVAARRGLRAARRDGLVVDGRWR